MGEKLAYLVTEDWYFLSHRLPMARAARDAGFAVHVLAREGSGRRAIEAEGFALHALSWKRAVLAPHRLVFEIAEVRKALAAIAPAVLHNIALKPAVIGTLASGGRGGPAIVNSINGLGSAYLAGGLLGAAKRQVLSRSLAMLLNRERSLTIVQNPEDFSALAGLGLPESRLRRIPGSGVDTERLQPQPEPLVGPVTVAYVGRMLADKGVRGLMAAHRQLRGRGVKIRLLLAGSPDPGNPTSIPTAELQTWAEEPGVTMLGHVTDIAGLWAQSHIAVLPSRREGLPLSLLEASACGRPMIATDVPGCREVVRDGETGLLVPLDDAPALAAAIARLAGDADLRARLGTAARRRAETEFSSAIIAAKTAELYREMAAG
jgi:glycosyltransferase involved in cell wall biosynthesis